LAIYCQGQGLDIGCGSTKIRQDAIGIDLYNPNADMMIDARDLSKYPPEHFDYIYSSHLLEEIENTEATLKEWLRILKDGGNMVLYQADKDLYFPIGNPNCNPNHRHHFDWESLWAIFQKIGGVELVHHGRYPETGEWSFELVVKKNLTGKKEEPMTEVEGISFLIPTRKRPKGMEDLTMSIDATTKNPQNIEIVFGINPEDQISIDKVSDLKTKSRLEIRYEIMKPEPDGKLCLASLWNQCYAVSKYPILGYFGDDVIFRTPGWDEEVRKTFAGNKGILFSCNDIHVQRGKQATLFFTHKTVHEKIGYYLYPKFRRWYSDSMMDFAYQKAGGLRYHDEIVTEHFHPDAFPDRADDVYTSMEYLKGEDHILWRSPLIAQEIDRCSKIISSIFRKQ
jgi:predicted SAM-dependent methyltransferase